MNNAITEIKSTLEGTNSRITEAEDRISEVEDRMVKINDAERKKALKKQVAKSHTKPIDTLKPTTGHFIALQREEIQLHPPEHQHKLP